MQAALHQHAGATEFNGLTNLFIDRVEVENVSLFCFRPFQRTIKRTERAIFRTEVRVVDVAIDDVGGDAFWMQATSDSIGFNADSDQIVRAVQIEGLSLGEGHGLVTILTESLVTPLLAKPRAFAQFHLCERAGIPESRKNCRWPRIRQEPEPWACSSG